jgi:hypothetical protein
MGTCGILWLGRPGMNWIISIWGFTKEKQWAQDGFMGKIMGIVHD